MTKRRLASLLAAACATLLAAASGARADTATLGVAANFVAPLAALERAFEAEGTHKLTIVAASTGQLYAQIVNGAPFDVLLAADQERPRLLAEQSWGDPATRFTYSTGRLALWSREPALREGLSLESLRTAQFRWLAMANPALAPYGAAAQQTLEALGVWEALRARIVQGQNIAQAFAMAETRNAELGLVALSQALTYEGRASYVVVPAELHAPIRQDAILLRRGRDNEAARAFLEFLRSAAAAAIMEQYGYSGAAR